MIISRNNSKAIILFICTISGIVFGLLNSVINTRVLSPEEYGNVRYVQSIISFVSSVLLWGYFVSGSRLLAISSSVERSRSIKGIMTIILLVTFLILLLVMTILYVTSINDPKNISDLLFISIPLCGNVLMLNYIETTAQGENQTGRISLARLLPPALYFIAAYFLFYKLSLASQERMLVLNNGIAMAVLAIIIASTKPSFKGLRNSFSILNEENKKYGLQVYIGSLFAVATGYLSSIALGLYCDNNINAGFFALAVTISSPLTMLPAVIGTTYFKKFANQDAINCRLLFGSCVLTAISCLIFILLIRYVVTALYTEKYEMVGRIATFLAVGCSMHGLGDMFNRFLGSHGKGKELRNGAILTGSVIIAGNFSLVYLWNIDGAIITKIAGDAVYLLMMVFYYCKFRARRVE